MEKSGPDFYDDQSVFDLYIQRRERPDSPNETIEQPILWELIGSPQGLDVLDLGCGDARIARQFKERRAKSCLGVEGSLRMCERASENIDSGFSSLVSTWLEDFEPPESSFDLVVSSLALHYIEDLSSIMCKVHGALRPKGRLVFSVEHPVITSSNQSLKDSSLRQAWIVDDYFNRGPRTVSWMGDEVRKYHRTIEDLLTMIQRAGLSLEALRESDPPQDQFKDEDLLARRKRIPLFMFISAVKA